LTFLSASLRCALVCGRECLCHKCKRPSQPGAAAAPESPEIRQFENRSQSLGRKVGRKEGRKDQEIRAFFQQRTGTKPESIAGEEQQVKSSR